MAIVSKVAGVVCKFIRLYHKEDMYEQRAACSDMTMCFVVFVLFVLLVVEVIQMWVVQGWSIVLGYCIHSIVNKTIISILSFLLFHFINIKCYKQHTWKHNKNKQRLLHQHSNSPSDSNRHITKRKRNKKSKWKEHGVTSE